MTKSVFRQTDAWQEETLSAKKSKEIYLFEKIIFYVIDGSLF